MSSKFRTACWISLAISAGMVSQELVSRLVAHEQSEVDVQALAASRWSDRETFYARTRLTDDPRWQPVEAEQTPLLAAAAPDGGDTPEEVTLPLEPLIASHAAEATEAAEEEAVEPALRVALRQTELHGIGVRANRPLLAQQDRPQEEEEAESDRLEPAAAADVADEPDAIVAVPDEQPLPPIAPVAESTGRVESPVGVLPPPADPPLRKSSRSPEDYAQRIESEEPRPAAAAKPGQYEQARAIIQQQAAERAAERRRRIELRKWMGYSAARPPMPATPMMTGETRRPALVLVPVIVPEGEPQRR